LLAPPGHFTSACPTYYQPRSSTLFPAMATFAPTEPSETLWFYDLLLWFCKGFGWRWEIVAHWYMLKI